MRRAFTVVGVLVLTLLTVPTPPAGAGTSHPRVVRDNPVNVTPNVVDDGVVAHTAVHAFRQVGDTMYAGGQFHRVTNAAQTRSYTRSNLMAFDANTGALRSFAPSVGGTVWAVAARGRWLWVAGSFTTVNGLARRGVVKLNATTGAVARAFNARLPQGQVQDMHLSKGRLFIGGSFPEQLITLNRRTGANTGYLDVPITGTLADNAGFTDVYRFAINPTGTRLVALGNFTSVGGHPRRQAFMLALGSASARLSRWYYRPLDNRCRSPRLPFYLRGVDFSPNGRYFVLVSTGNVPMAGGVGRDICDAAARFETAITAPTRPTWINYTGGDTLHSVVVTGPAVYVQGHQRWLDNPWGRNSAGPGARARPGIGAIGPRTGKALSWNPGKSRAVGGKVLYATRAGLWVGSDGPSFAGEYRDNIAFCPL